MAVTEKKILLLARRDHTEAMRVASGLTIVGHQVRLVFMTEPVAQTEANAEQAELLDLADIEPETTVPEMADELTHLDAAALGEAIAAADVVINV
ncbi:thioesterase domain-containing protein [Rhodobium orientis]|uniref:Uncharacterized protein n=1 Tax=Rhodobium orientis TaxID=34017 RepID=A0A327JTK6_9HYPH|nr:hypothetical protein [Rhodobium orientis]MBB4302762.1 thioesterase domain-containing protein [Rhodobium orientis]MBK5948542.1 hypothetical protein [Rhodobium orientis]RAI29809.1 hypothetical protein CH339_01980 [Rhodobium orientis]